MPIAVFDLVAIIAAVGLAAIGGEAFFKAIIALAKRLQVPNALVATTIAAFATSTPELTVSTMAALSGQPEIGLGDALGSNVVNIALIFGIALWFGPIRPSNEDFRGDFKLALLVPLLTLVLALDGRLSRADGLILLLLFSTWLGLIVRATLQRRHEHFEPHSSPASSMLTTLGLGALGLGALMELQVLVEADDRRDLGEEMRQTFLPERRERFKLNRDQGRGRLMVADARIGAPLLYGQGDTANEAGLVCGLRDRSGGQLRHSTFAPCSMRRRRGNPG